VSGIRCQAKRFLPIARLAVFFSIASIAGAAMGAKAPAGKKKPAGANKNTAQASVRMSAEGLKPNSQRLFWVWRKSVCAAKVPAGSKRNLPPGTYDIRVGFTSGYVSRTVELKAGQQYEVPTGLFTFRQITPNDLLSSVPQKLYHGGNYLVTGYQGTTARLYDGTYKVYYQDIGQQRPATAFGPWHVMGVFPNPQKPKKNMGYHTAYGPEEDLIPDLKKTYEHGGRTFAWRKLEDYPEVNLAELFPAWGIAYATASINSDEQREAELIVTYRGGIKIWLNGEPVRQIAPTARAYMPQRTSGFVRLKKGRNVLLVKTPRANLDWSLGAVAVRWRSYEAVVTVGGQAEPVAFGGPVAAVPAGRYASPATEMPPAVEGIVFCQVPDLPNGRSGLHHEQFRIVHRPERSRICSLIPATPYGKLTDLTGDTFVSAIQPDLSYDGRKVIFAAKKTPQEKWSIFEMNLDGGGKRQITRDMEDCIDPYYLPDGRIVFSSGAVRFRDEYDRDPCKVLFRCNPDGSGAEQLTFNLSSDTASIVLDDGRLLFTSWQHHGDHQGVAGVFAFCTCNPDGTVFNLFTGNAREANNTKSYPQQLTDGRVVFVDSAGHRHYNSGGLSAVGPEKPLTNRKILTPGMIYNGYNLAGRYASPYPLPDGGMICSFSPGRGTGILREDPGEEIHMGIYHFDFKSGRVGKLIFDDPAAQDIDPIAIYTRNPPPVIPSLIDYKEKTGTFLCVNPYLSDRKPSPRVVVGELPPAEPGTIKGVRVLEGFGVEDTDVKKHRHTIIDILQMSFGSNNNSGNNFEQRRIVGYAPCEPDGSFHIEVPADTTLALQTLDQQGMAIETQLTWVWVRPGEKRMCVGCHEDREAALPNLDCMAMYKRPYPVAPPPEGRRTVDFRRDIMPIIEKKCATAGCHDSESKAGGLDFGGGFQLVFHRKGFRGRPLNGAFFNRAYESLLEGNAQRVGRLVVSGAAKYSPVIWRIYGRQLAQTDVRNPYQKQCKQMPPGEPLSEAEKRLFVEWIDLGAQWDNIPREDDLPGYNADESRILAAAAAEMVKKPISDPQQAFRIRCTECHDTRCILMAKNSKKEEARWRETIDRMVAKRRVWFHDSEIPLITGHVLENYFKARPKKP